MGLVPWPIWGPYLLKSKLAIDSDSYLNYNLNLLTSLTIFAEFMNSNNFFTNILPTLDAAKSVKPKTDSFKISTMPQVYYFMSDNNHKAVNTAGNQKCHNFGLLSIYHTHINSNHNQLIFQLHDDDYDITLIIIKLYLDTIKSGTYVPFTGV